MPREVTITLYLYDELEAKAKEKAKNWWKSCWDENDNRQITEMFEYELGEAGYPTGDISWSLSYCQGDGMAFYTMKDNADLKRIWLRRISRGWPRADRRALYCLLKTFEVDLTLSITRNAFGNHYSHYNTMRVLLESSYQPEHTAFAMLLEKLEKDIADDVRSLSKALAAKGYAEIEHMQSDESVASAMEANEYTFTKDGTRHD